MADADSVETRTGLAVERTMLAWWRTALTALAVALGVGRLLPELSGDSRTWPYVALGLGFAVYAIGLFGFGTARLSPTGARPPTSILVVAGSGTLLGIATAALIAAG
jgi:putative membrane protein